jgi:hypothetical protein
MDIETLVADWSNMQSLLKYQDEYIKLLEKTIDDTHAIAAIHHYRASPEDVESGQRLRGLIETLREKT